MYGAHGDKDHRCGISEDENGRRQGFRRWDKAGKHGNGTARKAVREKK